ncbi:MAG: magnesium transporter [Armatimonadota bacterium]
MFLTEVLGRPLLDHTSRRVGRVVDVVADLSQLFPPVVGIEVRMRDITRVIPYTHIAELRPAVTLRPGAPIEADLPLRDEYRRLGAEFLDRQIVDIQGHRVVRVNDIRLADFDGKLRLIGVDVGLRGLLRRIGIEGAAESIVSLLGLTLHTHIIDWRDVEPLPSGKAPMKLRVPTERLSRLHPADIADIIDQLDPAERRQVLESLDVETAADALTEAEPEVQVSIMESLEAERASDILEEMEPDEAADLLADLPEERSDELLNLMEPEDAAEVRELLTYEEDVAGGIMTTACAVVAPDLTVAEALEELRKPENEAESIYYVYVVSGDERLVGVVSLKELITADSKARIGALMEQELVTIGPDTSLQETALLMAKYNLIALPVVDDNRRLEGVVTVDDVLDLIIPEEWKRQQPRAHGR